MCPRMQKCSVALLLLLTILGSLCVAENKGSVVPGTIDNTTLADSLGNIPESHRLLLLGDTVRLRELLRTTPDVEATLAANYNIPCGAIPGCVCNNGIFELAKGQTLLFTAARCNNEEWLNFLIKAGANLEAYDFRGRTALHIAAACGHVRAMSILVGAGMPINIPTRVNEESLAKTLKYQKKQGPEYDFAQNRVGLTALHEAAVYNNLPAVQWLVEHGADVNATSQVGWTPLHCAAMFAKTDNGALLLESGANVNASSKSNFTPLHLAAESGLSYATKDDVRVPFVEMLIKCGAILDATDACGQSPLHWAAKTGNVWTVKALLKAGAKKDLKDSQGKTSADWARDTKNRTLINLFERENSSE